MSVITVEKEGRRYYLQGNTYSIKDELKEAGCKWDRDRRQWYTGKKETAERFVGKTVDNKSSNEARGDDQVVAGRGEYKGKTYYLAGTAREYDRTVSPVQTRDGRKMLLVFRDGSKQFWADNSQVKIVKTYSTPKTIGALKEFSQRAKSGEPQCAECGGFGELVADLEDGMMKHRWCCDIKRSVGYVT